MADHVVELFYDDTWNDITLDVRQAAPVTIARGRRDWSSHADPATMTLRLNNGASNLTAGVVGRYSPRNPGSDLYGLIGRNTPVRMRIGERHSSLYLSGTTQTYAAVPDHPSIRLTGDQRFEIYLEPSTWRPAGTVAIARRYLVPSNQRAWAFLRSAAGEMVVRWSADGVTFTDAWSGAVIPADAGPLWVAWEIDVDNGSSGTDLLFETAVPDADGEPGTWATLGAVTVAGTTSVYAAEVPLEIGRTSGDGAGGVASSAFTGRLGAVRYRDASGTIVAGTHFRDREPETRTLTDDAGLTWALHGGAFFGDPSIRFCGEAASWPLEWGLAGVDGWVTLTAAGISRRLQQGSQPLRSSLYRDLSASPAVVAYWPMEEPDGALRFTSGLANDPSSLTIQGDIAPGKYDGFAASAPLPEFRIGIATGSTPAFAPATNQRFLIVVAVPADGLPAERRLFTVLTSGSLRRFEVNCTTTGGVRVTVIDEDGNTADTILTGFGINGELVMLSLWLEQRGADTFYQISRFRLVGGGANIGEATITGATYGRMTGVSIGSGNGLEATAMGHAAIITDDVHSVWGLVGRSLTAWTGESGAARLHRLAADEGLPAVRVVGDGASTETMGPQRIRTLPELVREVPEADMGMLTDRADTPAYQYRPRTTLYNQTPGLVLDYSAGLIAPPFQPTEDDQATRNDITISRPRGSTVTVRAETGPLSVQPPPDGVGVYAHSQEINIDTDARLLSQAGWRLHLGTVDGARYATLRLNLRNERVAALTDQVLALSEGDLIRITNLPPQVPPGPIDLMIEGLTEEKSATTHEIEFNCSPGEAWTVFTLDDPVRGRLDTGGSGLALAVGADDTELLVATDPGRATWIDLDPDTDEPFALYVGSEAVIVHAITGTDSPQSMTVTRAATGYGRAWPAGTRVRLAPVAVGA